MNRRGFLAGILAAGVAPAAVGSKILMPIRPLGLSGDFTPGMWVYPDSKYRMIEGPVYMDYPAGTIEPVSEATLADVVAKVFAMRQQQIMRATFLHNNMLKQIIEDRK